MFKIIRDQKVAQKKKDLELIDAALKDNSENPEALKHIENKKKEHIKEMIAYQNQVNPLEAAYLYLQTDNPTKYGKHMKGFVIPFGADGQRLDQMTFLTDSVKQNMGALNLRVSLQ